MDMAVKLVFQSSKKDTCTCFTSKSIPPLNPRSTPAQKSLWWDRLEELVSKERSHTPRATNVQVTYFDQTTNFEHVSPIQYSSSTWMTQFS